jgi:hypothetical protein
MACHLHGDMRLAQTLLKRFLFSVLDAKRHRAEPKGKENEHESFAVDSL